MSGSLPVNASFGQGSGQPLFPSSPEGLGGQAPSDSFFFGSSLDSSSSNFQAAPDHPFTSYPVSTMEWEGSSPCMGAPLEDFLSLPSSHTVLSVDEEDFYPFNNSSSSSSQTPLSEPHSASPWPPMGWEQHPASFHPAHALPSFSLSAQVTSNSMCVTSSVPLSSFSMNWQPAYPSHVPPSQGGEPSSHSPSSAFEANHLPSSFSPSSSSSSNVPPPPAQQDSHHASLKRQKPTTGPAGSVKKPKVDEAKQKVDEAEQKEDKAKQKAKVSRAFYESNMFAIRKFVKSGLDISEVNSYGQNAFYRFVAKIQGIRTRATTEEELAEIYQENDREITKTFKLFMRTIKDDSFDRADRWGITPALKLVMNAMKDIIPPYSERAVSHLPRNPRPIFFSCISSLLRRGADPNAVFENMGESTAQINGMSFLHLAVCVQDLKIVRAVLDSGAKVDQQIVNWRERNTKKHQFALRHSGKAALHIAAGLLNEQIVELLIQRKANVRIKDSRKNTPLMIALASLRHRNVQVLIAGGATVGNKEGRYARSIVAHMQKTLGGPDPSEEEEFYTAQVNIAAFNEEDQGFQGIQNFFRDRLHNVALAPLEQHMPKALALMVIDYVWPPACTLEQIIGTNNLKENSRDKLMHLRNAMPKINDYSGVAPFKYWYEGLL